MSDADEKKLVTVDPVKSDDGTGGPKDEKIEPKKDVDRKQAEVAEGLTEEDKKLKDTLDTLVARVLEKTNSKDDEVLQHNALEQLRREIRSSTASMTSVPKPLKFMRPHYAALEIYYDGMAAGENKMFLADVLSVLAMTMAAEGKRDSLRFKLAGHRSELGSFGHEYVRNLAGEIGTEYAVRQETDAKCDDLLGLVHDIVPFQVAHNAEVEAIDLLIEVEQLSAITERFNKDNVERICRYLLSLTPLYGVDVEEQGSVLNICFQGYFSTGHFPDALRVAIRMDKIDLIHKVLAAPTEPAMQRQLGYMVGAAKLRVGEGGVPAPDDSALRDIYGNVPLNAHYLELAKELNVRDPKSPEDIYKTHLAEGGSAIARHNRPGASAAASATVDNAKQNLAATFVNAFVNCGFGKDLLLTPDGSEWVYKNKAGGMLSAAASVGMILMWDMDNGFNVIDKFSIVPQKEIKAGALLAQGILQSGIQGEMDAASDLLSPELESKDLDTKLSAIFGLALAYAGTARQDVLEKLTPLIVDPDSSMEVVSLVCLALGFVFVGTCHDGVLGNILQAFLDRSDTDLKDSNVRLMCLALGLLYLGQGEASEAGLAVVSVIDKPIKKYLELTVLTCAYVGSSNVLQVQKLLTVCADHLEDDEKDPIKGIHQEVALLGIAMIAMGEDVGAEMALRVIDHILQYGEVNIRRAVPISLACLSISNPRLTVMDTLSKLSHDSDQVVSLNACLSLGFLGAGTNNARIAHMLRTLATYYEKEPNHLFVIRIAQGLLHMGKGLMTLNPFYSDSFLLNKVGMAGLLTVFHSALDLKNSILSKRHFLLFSLVTSVRPRMLITVDAEGKSVPVSVRVGMAVDTVGQAGKPKTITGFQTHTTPVLLAAGERAEFATDKYIALASVLEGFVVVKENPASKDRLVERTAPGGASSSSSSSSSRSREGKDEEKKTEKKESMSL